MAAEDFDIEDDIDLIAIDWRMRIESGEISPEERSAFEAWRDQNERHADAYDRAFTMWEALGSLDRGNLQPELFQRSWHFRARRFLISLPRDTFKRYRGFASAAIAGAALVAALGFAVLSQPWGGADTVIEMPVMTAFETNRGETKEIALSDGSKMTLGAATRVEVAMSSGSREIKLKSGAAVFDVASDADRPFSVTAENFTAKVVGTIFDVRNNGGVVRLSVAEGSVEVGHPIIINNTLTSMTTRKTVTAGEQVTATASEGMSQVSAFREEDFAIWREDRLRYVGATLKELVADANRYSTREILLEEKLAQTVTERATFSFEGKDVDRLLSTLPVLFPVDIEDEGVGAIRIIARNSAE